MEKYFWLPAACFIFLAFGCGPLINGLTTDGLTTNGSITGISLDKSSASIIVSDAVASRSYQLTDEGDFVA